MSDSNRKSSYFHSKPIILLLAITQVLGLLPAVRDTKSLQLKKSNFLVCYYLLIFIFFTIVFPITIYTIFTKSTQPKGISDSINRSYFVIIYVLSIFGYIDRFFKSNIQIQLLNEMFRTSDVVSEIRSKIIMVRGDLLLFLFRIFYIYFGYGYLIIMDNEVVKSLSYLHWISFLMPDFIAGVGMLWIHVLMVLQINNVRKMRKGFSDCIDMANGSIGLAPAMRHIICCRANDTFDKISGLYTFCSDLYRAVTENAPYIIMVVLVKIFVNTTNMVSKHEKILGKG